MSDTIINIGIYVTYALVAVALISTVFFAIFHMARNFRKAKGALLGILILAAIIVFSYAISTSEVYPNAGPVVSQWVGGGITTTFILAGLAFLAAIYTEVSKFFK